MSKVFNTLDMFAEPEIELEQIIFKASASESWMRFNPEMVNEEDFCFTPEKLEFSVYMKKGIFELIEYFETVNRSHFEASRTEASPLRFKIYLSNFIASRVEIIFEGAFHGFECTGNICLLKFKGQYVSNSYTSRSAKEYISIAEEE